MKYYELTYLLAPELSETEVQDIQEKINSSIQSKEGLLDSSMENKKVRLANPVKKRLEAYLLSTDFYLKKEKINELETELRTDNSILRFILFGKRKIKEIKPRLTKPVEKETEKEEPKKQTEKKVKLKDIEEKLEEILE